MAILSHLQKRGAAWGTATFLVLLHVVAGYFAWIYCTWGALVAFAVLTVVTGMGVTLVYHRYLTHAGFQTYRWFENLLLFAGVLSGQGPPQVWVADHRKHHRYSDKPGDPHSPVQDGFLWAHIFWLMVNRPEVGGMEAYFQKYTPDLEKKWFVKQFNKTYLLWHAVLILLLAGIGWFTGGSYGAVAFVAWGFGVRMVFVYHSTWLVNSWSHMWGYRTHGTTDDSRNNWLVALLTFGEGWHNNHHAWPRRAFHGERWWELDPTYWVIWILERCRLVWDVQRTSWR